MATSLVTTSADVQDNAITLWYLDSANQLAFQRVDRSMLITFDRDRPLQPVIESSPDHAVVRPATLRESLVALIAVVFIPEPLNGAVSLNGVPLSPGMYCLVHGDALDNGHQSYWLSREPTVERTYYDPAVHGAGLTCFLTKAPLKPGDPITICPGTPKTLCAAIYKTSTWDKIMRPGSPLKCARCGYRPDSKTWKPSPPVSGKNHHEYLKYFDQ